MHAALWLVIVLGGAAAQYLLLAAEFVAVTQVLVYIGAVMVLFLFGTMLTRAQHRPGGRPQQQALGDRHPRSRCCSLGVLGYALIDAFDDDEAARADPAIDHHASRSATRIFGPYLSRSGRCRSCSCAAVVGAIVPGPERTERSSC